MARSCAREAAGPRPRRGRRDRCLWLFLAGRSGSPEGGPVATSTSVRAPEGAAGRCPSGCRVRGCRCSRARCVPSGEDACRGRGWRSRSGSAHRRSGAGPPSGRARPRRGSGGPARPGRRPTSRSRPWRAWAAATGSPRPAASAISWSSSVSRRRYWFLAASSMTGCGPASCRSPPAAACAGPGARAQGIRPQVEHVPFPAWAGQQGPEVAHSLGVPQRHDPALEGDGPVLPVEPEHIARAAEARSDARRSSTVRCATFAAARHIGQLAGPPGRRRKERGSQRHGDQHDQGGRGGVVAGAQAAVDDLELAAEDPRRRHRGQREHREQEQRPAPGSRSRTPRRAEVCLLPNLATSTPAPMNAFPLAAACPGRAA